MSRQDLSQRLEVGALLIIETGSYSDRVFNDPLRVLKPFILGDVANLYKKLYIPEEDAWDDDRIEHDAFIPFLISQGFCTPIDSVYRWNIGDGSSFEP